MGGGAGPDVLKARKERWADQIIIAQDGCMGRQMFRDMTELAAVEQLGMGEVDIADAERTQIGDQGDAADDGG